LVETPTGAFLEKGLLHRTTRGEFVRSKSEVVIAELLHARKIPYAYERKLAFDDGSFRYPDFTVQDDDTGQTFYWEHLGMLGDSVYRERWEAKRRWYAEHGVVTHPESGSHVLVSTEDSPAGGLDAARVGRLIDELFA
jgi:hypothetical protein